MDDYKESHIFPSGLEIDYYSTLDDDYYRELNDISSQEELVAFVERWRYLCPEIVSESFSFDLLKELRGNPGKQEEHIQKCGGIDQHLMLIIPKTMLVYSIKSRHYGVTVGLVVLQLWNANCFKQSEDGSWILQMTPLINEENHS